MAAWNRPKRGAEPSGTTQGGIPWRRRGLTLIAPARRDPRRTSTYGFGQLLEAARRDGAGAIIAGIGGSATNDGGAGFDVAWVVKGEWLKYNVKLDQAGTYNIYFRLANQAAGAQPCNCRSDIPGCERIPDGALIVAGESPDC